LWGTTLNSVAGFGDALALAMMPGRSLDRHPT